MRPASPALVALLASTRQVAIWEEFTFDLANGTQVVYSTRDADALPPMTVPAPPPPPGGLWLEDTFSGANGSTLATHVGETGATWSSVGGSDLAWFELDGAGTVFLNTSTTASAAPSGVPPDDTSDYYVSAGLTFSAGPTSGPFLLASLGVFNNDTEYGWGVEVSIGISGSSNLAVSGFIEGPDSFGDIPYTNTGVLPSSTARQLVVQITEGRTRMTVKLDGATIGSVSAGSLPVSSAEDVLSVRLTTDVPGVVRVSSLEGGLL